MLVATSLFTGSRILGIMASVLLSLPNSELTNVDGEPTLHW